MNRERFAAIDAPLADVNVIEANAGTGKTFTITALYARLLLEARCAVDSVLVVTFTEAATGELRDRIRTRLAGIRAAFERGTAAPEDDFAAALLERIADREEALRRLTSALHDFDQAPIYTIHAFCQRALGDSAFESGMPFRTEIIPDQSAILREIVEDFWRITAASATPLFTRYLAKAGIDPDTLLRDGLERDLAKRHIEIRKPAEPNDLAALEREYETAYARARAIWGEERDAIGRKLLGNTSLNGNAYRRRSIPAWLAEMHACLAPERPHVELCAKFEKFTRESLAKGTNARGATPTHPFFDACSALAAAHAPLVEAYRRAVLLTRVRLLEYCNDELETRKARRQLQSFDDLLVNLARALDSESGATLVARLRERYRAALIDEFQDTDPVQYGIFRRIYAGTGQPLFLVGDPKQSIYSFRGADVYAYIGARADARYRHTLDVNWRSVPPLLDAVNRLFANAPDPFAIEAIPFRASTAAPGARGRLVIEGDGRAAFELWVIESEDGRPINKDDAADAAARATAAEIARLLTLGERDLARIEERGEARRLRGGDIAVLARSHRRGQAVREALAALGIASVQRGSASVFATPEAEELERVLAAIAEPGRDALVGAALSTAMLGYSGEELYALHRDEARWEDIVESFREAHRVWHEAGFVRMLRGFMQRHEVLARLLEYADGERRATNLLHLAELLHCDAGRQGIGALLGWLAAKRRSPAEGSEPELLRLESDENLVKIFTVHAAKGLEFPIVFCPFLWDANLRSTKGQPIRFHDPERAHAAVVDFGSEAIEESRPQAVLEEHAENLRLLYVALTRARYRCCAVWGNVREAESAAPAWLLHRHGESRTQDAGRLTNERLHADLTRLALAAEGSIRVTPLPREPGTRVERAGAGAAAFAARAFEGAVRDARRVTSFTALAHGRSIEAPDYDAADRAPRPESVSGRDIFAFPRGAHAGKCLHAIFEAVDFARIARPELERIVAKALAAHGFDPVWLRGVADMVEAVVHTPLDPDLRLCDIARERRLDELEFYYPIARLSERALRGLLLSGGFPSEIRERIGELTFAPVQGYMRGFIDLVFEHGGRYYIADYKSNWLGASVSAYGAADLARAMARETYYLQYLVYCVAVHRYLRVRVPGYRFESHFGGVYYLFLRGMRPAAGDFGVYRDKPSRALIEALDAQLAGAAL